ncbi:MAG: glycosyltransferase family 2 protein [bacterium]
MRISVVIPSYNRINMLEELLNSLHNQTFKDFEVTIVDDNSPNTDALKMLENKFQNSFKKLTLLINDKNMGAPYSRNRGIQHSSAPWIALVDDDDLWHTQKLEKQWEQIQQADSQLGIIYSWCHVIDTDGNIIGEKKPSTNGKLQKQFLTDCIIPSPTVMIRKQALLEANGFDESLPSCQDWDMWIRILKLGYHCQVIQEHLALYRKHNTSSIGTSPRAKEGYLKFYKKHWKLLFKYMQLKHFKRWLRLLMEYNGIYK